MAGFTKFVSMARDDEDMLDTVMPMPVKDMPQYPYGLRICLCEEELDKLDLEEDFEVGDTIDMRAMAKVTSVSSDETPAGKRRRVELQIEQLAVEVEDDE
jgi:hypothetical protein